MCGIALTKGERNFCSRDCIVRFTRLPENLTPLTCDTCGKEYHVRKNKGRDGVKHYCSNKCKGEGRKGSKSERVTKTCQSCGKEFTLRASDGRLKNGKDVLFCSRICRMALIKPKPLALLTCDMCGKEYTKPLCRLGKHGKNYCSNACRRIGRRKADAKWKSPSYIRAYNKDYRQKNRERLKEKKLEYARWHRAEKALVQRNRQRQMRVTGRITPEDWEGIKAKYSYTCLCCKKREPEIALTLDHVIPLRYSGEHSVENVQPLCRHCNSSKSTSSTDYRVFYDNNLGGTK